MLKNSTIMEDESLETRRKKIVRLTLMGSFVNAFLIVLKITTAIFGRSSAMLADAVHSISDFLTDFIVIIMMRISSKPSDKDHSYGHGKYETLATTIIGLLLFLVGAGIVWSSSKNIIRFFQGHAITSPNLLAFIAAITSILLKELTYQITIRKGKSLKSKALEANAWHHRSDALSSIGTAIGIGGAILLGEKWAVLDPIAALIVSFFIFKVSIQLIKSSINELLEFRLPENIEKQIIETSEMVDGVKDIHNLKTRQIGNTYAISMHVRMDGKLSLEEAHEKATDIENLLKKEFGERTFIDIHFEPWKINEEK